MPQRTQDRIQFSIYLKCGTLQEDATLESIQVMHSSNGQPCPGQSRYALCLNFYSFCFDCCNCCSCHIACSLQDFALSSWVMFVFLGFTVSGWFVCTLYNKLSALASASSAPLLCFLFQGVTDLAKYHCSVSGLWSCQVRNHFHSNMLFATHKTYFLKFTMHHRNYR